MMIWKQTHIPVYEIKFTDNINTNIISHQPHNINWDEHTCPTVHALNYFANIKHNCGYKTQTLSNLVHRIMIMEINLIRDNMEISVWMGQKKKVIVDMKNPTDCCLKILKNFDELLSWTKHINMSISWIFCRNK